VRYAAAAVLGLCSVSLCSPAQAETARDVLVNAAFFAPTKAAALARVNQAVALAEGAVKRDPRDQNARLQHALAISYRGKLNRSRADVIAARRVFEAMVAANPRDPEAQMALAGWHLAAVIELGPMVARTVLGARTASGNSALDRALALGRNRASIPALASLQRIQLSPNDVAGARRLAEVAMAAGADTAFDRVMQKQAAALLPALRAGNGKAAAALAKRLMPFGKVE
jgi:hypothetical protein